MTQIYRNEGPFGFAKGLSAGFYGSIFSGFVYFYLYKKIKLSLYDYFGDTINPAIVFLLASMIAEVFTIVVYFPYDLVKCRLQSKNNIFKYKNLPHAFRQEFNQNGISGLYKGSFPFFITYTSFVTIQFPLYENFMHYFKKKQSKEEYQRNETKLSILASCIAGGVAAALTNPFECITVNM